MNWLIYRWHIDDKIPAGSVRLLDLKSWTRLGEYYRLSASPSALVLFHTGAHGLRIKYVHSLELSGRSDRQTDRQHSITAEAIFHYFQRKWQLLKLLLLGWERKKTARFNFTTCRNHLKIHHCNNKESMWQLMQHPNMVYSTGWWKHINIQPKMVKNKTN